MAEAAQRGRFCPEPRDEKSSFPREIRAVVSAPEVVRPERAFVSCTCGDPGIKGESSSRRDVEIRNTARSFFMPDVNTRIKRPKLIGLSHMTFQSSALEEALAYYRDVHGYEEQLLLRDASGRIERAFVMVNEAQWVELRPEHKPNSDRLIQFGFQVEDAEAMRAYLESKGIAVPGSTSVSAIGNRSFYAKDPDGHSVEFVQRLPQGWPAKAAKKSSNPKALSTCLMHLGFDVYSLDKAMAFYRDVLGCVEFWRGSSDERSLAWVQLKLPEDKNYIELMLYDEPPSLEWLGVLNHFGLEVASMATTMEEASRRIGPKEYPRDVGYSIGKCRHRLANIYDPDGSRAEFMERKTCDGSITPSSPLPPPH